MAEIQVICTGCSRRYKIKGSDETLRTQNFRCPACGFEAPFSAVQDWGETYFGKKKVKKAEKATVAKKNDGDHTMIKGRSVAYGQTATLNLPAYQIRIALKEGNFILGRRSSDSKADIKLAPDPYMSREHALLQVSRDGMRMRYAMKALKAENPVFLNNSRLCPSDVVLLQPGDVLVMGQTKIIFEVN